MSKSNIALAIIAGAAIGAIVAIALRVEKTLEEENNDDYEEESSVPKFETIARQFSDRIASDLKKAERKIKSAVTGDNGFVQPEGDFGIFL